MEIGREMNFSGEISLEKKHKAKKEEKLRESFRNQGWDLESSIAPRKITAGAGCNHTKK